MILSPSSRLPPHSTPPHPTGLLSNFLTFRRVSRPAAGFLNCGGSMHTTYLENTPAQSLTPNQLNQNIWGWEPGHEYFWKSCPGGSNVQPGVRTSSSVIWQLPSSSFPLLPPGSTSLSSDWTKGCWEIWAEPISLSQEFELRHWGEVWERQEREAMIGHRWKVGSRGLRKLRKNNENCGREGPKQICRRSQTSYCWSCPAFIPGSS